MRPHVPGLVLLCLAFATLPAAAQRVEWRIIDGGNGHTYEAVYVDGGVNWSDARTSAVARGGDLACINSAAENNFVLSVVDNPLYWYESQTGRNLGPWIGGIQTQATSPHQWVSGEPFDYTNWYPNEPYDAVGFDNHRIHLVAQLAPARDNLWSEAYDTSLLNGYVVEYTPTTSFPTACGAGCAPNSPLTLAALPLALIVLRRR